jgi:molecular chaperone DnaJ
MSSKRCYYEVLSVSRDASDGVISSSYRKLAIRYHPDSNPDSEEATLYFKEAAEAYEVLGDGQKRAAYDQYGHAAFEGGQQGGGQGFSNAEDIFEAFGDLFGGGGGGGIFGDLFGGGGGRRRGRGPRRGADLKTEVTLDLEEAAAGVKKTLEFIRSKQCTTCDGKGARRDSDVIICGRCEGRGQVVQSAGILRVQTVCPSCHGSGKMIAEPCGDCAGNGRVADEVELEVAIPAGVDNGTRVRITGEGEPSPGGGPSGDMYCFIHVREHSLFQRDGNQLVLRLPITYSQATLGADVEVPTLQGRDHINVPKGTQSGEVFRLRGRGMPDPHGRHTGDLLVQVFVEVPKKTTSRQEELLRELAEIENTEVSPHRKSFLESLAGYFTSEDTASGNDE